MNTTLLLKQAGKEVEHAKMQVAVDAKAAQLAHELARAAKVNLKHARKLAKMARKSARKAEDRAEESSATLETAQAKLEALRVRIRKEQRKNKPSPIPKPPASKAPVSRRSPRKTLNGKPAKPVPAARQNLGDLNPLPASDAAAPSFSGKEPKND